ncbi:MAG: flavodoxin [Campylobacteraceae bacterium]
MKIYLVLIIFINTLFASENTLIVYLTRTENTKQVAYLIKDITKGDIAQIKTVQTYPEDYKKMVAQANFERENNIKPLLEKLEVDVSNYDNIFIGFPIWGMDLPSPIKSFLAEYDLSNKTIIPFATHGGYGVGKSFETLVKLLPKSSKVKSGFSIRGGLERDGKILMIKDEKETKARAEVHKWLKSIGY